MGFNLAGWLIAPQPGSRTRHADTLLAIVALMATGWQWVADGQVRVGVTTSRREATTSTVVLAAGHALLVDPAWEPDELDWIADELQAAGITVTAGFATHSHHDHLLWHPRWSGAVRWASGPAANHAASRRGELVAALGSGWPEQLTDLVGRVTPTPGDHLPWTGPTVELITHDAHAPGHTALWIPAVRVLIAGDMLSDVEIPLLEQSGPADYDAALTALRDCVSIAEVLVPGHGSPAIGPAEVTARWVADRRYLDALLAGRGLIDPRLDHPGMRESHAHNRSRAGL